MVLVDHQEKVQEISDLQASVKLSMFQDMAVADELKMHHLVVQNHPVTTAMEC